jgi:hypothetical protein
VNPRVWKIVGAVALGLVVAFGAGWLWGASGRWDAERRLSTLELQHQMTAARAHLLAARVDLYGLNFGAATQNLETAKAMLSASIAELDRGDDATSAATLRTALTETENARRQAAQVNQAAQASAEKALKALAEARPFGQNLVPGSGS